MTSNKTFMHQLPSPATVRILGAGLSERQIPAQLDQTGGSMLRLFTSEHIPQNSPVRIDVAGGLVLGEVSNCQKEDSLYSVHVKIEQVIPSISDLARLVSAVLGQRSGAPAREETQVPVLAELAPTQSVRDSTR